MSAKHICAPSQQSISNSSTGSQKGNPLVSAPSEWDKRATFKASLSALANVYNSDKLNDEKLKEELRPELKEKLKKELDDNSEYLVKDQANQATSTPFVSADTSSVSVLTLTWTPAPSCCTIMFNGNIWW